MEVYDQYPGVDENFNFPPEILNALSKSDELKALSRDRGNLPSGSNLNLMYGPNYNGIWSIPTTIIAESILNRPTGAGAGYVNMIPLGSTASIQIWVEYVQPGRMWFRSILSSGGSLVPWKDLTSPISRGSIANSTLTSIDEISENCEYEIWSGSAAAQYGFPFTTAGKIRTEILGNLTLQTARTFLGVAPGPSQKTRAKGSTGWGEWFDSYPTTIPDQIVEVKARSGYKNAPIALTQQSSGGTEVISSASERLPLMLSIPTKRARLHIANRNYYSGVKYPTSASITGVWIGESTSGGNFSSTPTKVVSEFQLPTDGSKITTPWFNFDIEANSRYLLSYGVNASNQTVAQSRGGAYRSTSSSDASLASGYPSGSSSTTIFDVWLEIEVPSNTPIVAGFGDSNTVGTGTALPVYDSWLSQYCRDNGALPYHMSVHGSNSSSWSDPSAPAWGHYSESAPADCVVYFLGQNDLQEGITLATMQSNLATTLSIVRSKIADDVYVATVTPANAKTSDVNAVRKSYNTWLKTKPHGVKDCFDFSSAVSDDDTTIRTSDNADGIHMLTSGHTKMAAEITKRPVNPKVLTDTEIASLRALV